MTGTLPLRVMVEDVWNEVPLEVPPETSLGEIKRQALQASYVTQDPSHYLLKFRGAELTEESRSAADAGLVPNGALIVLARRRRPVR
ncbi:MAG TPA: hypothetical protein VFH24_02540 [Gemmatimonadales bacterium]|nr:hypothetical protein [Gemmatimonadales bacterium]